MTYAHSKQTISPRLLPLAAAIASVIASTANAQAPSPQASSATRTASGPSAGYGERVARYIKPNLAFDSLPDSNAFAVVELKVAPTGEVLSYAITTSSGNADWDRAVLRAISRTPQLPRDVDGTAPPTMRLTFRARE